MFPAVEEAPTSKENSFGRQCFHAVCITYDTVSGKKAPTGARGDKKHPQGPGQKAPRVYYHGGRLGVVVVSARV